MENDNNNPPLKVPSARKITMFFKSVNIFEKDPVMTEYIKYCLKNKKQLIEDRKKWINGLMTPEGIFIPCNYGCHSNLREYLMRTLKLSKSPYPYAPEDVADFEDKHVNFNDCNYPPYNAPIVYRGENLTPHQKLSIYEWAKVSMIKNYEIKTKGYYSMGPTMIIDNNFQVKKKEDGE